MINPNTKGMLVVPVSSKDKDAIRWIKGQKDYLKTGERPLALAMGMKAETECFYRFALDM